LLVGIEKFMIFSPSDLAYNLGPKTSSNRAPIHYAYPRKTGTMNLDLGACSRARLARDARFDGKFFIGVLTTKIYCRPICRSRTSKESNVRYFASAAAAAEAGFRPCLRCRPECSPGTPAWAGTQNTVSRALRLISETGLEGGSVEALAEHLGVGSRHLRRLFLRHLGATPSAVAQTRRMHFAKRLIDETTLPMTQIAFTAGFGSVRRFNAAIRNVYHRTPSQIRSLAQKMSRQPENQYLFHLNFRPPYDWKRTLEFLAIQATPGVEVAEGGCFRRSISVSGNRGYFEVSLDASRNALNVRVQISDPRSLFSMIERIRAMFDLDADWPTIARTLGADPDLAAHISSHPGLRVPGCWNGFELVTRAILGQQIGTEKANALAGRMVRAFGQPFCPANGLTHLFPTPEVLANTDLGSIGLLRPQADAIRALARAVRAGQISFEKVVDSDAILMRLAEIPGTGESTAQWVAIRNLREPDAFPSADRHLARALALGSSSEFEQRSLAWRPWRAYAAIYLWTFAGEIRVHRNASVPSARKKVPPGKTAFHSRIPVAERWAS
jgi:AraC family transcriptional regulator of adaptative response / DNA-3-methyladenine glycosylase II